MSATSGTGEPRTICAERCGRVRVGDREPHQVGARLGERAHLTEGGRDVGGLGAGHGLDGDWRAAADCDAADPDLAGARRSPSVTALPSPNDTHVRAPRHASQAGAAPTS